MADGKPVPQKKKSQQFGQISLDLICRFDELTKYEVRVLCFLYGSRNRKSKKCNPSRKYISLKTKIDKGNLSRALAGLEQKKWIVEQDDGEFLLMENPPEKVVDSATGKVVDSATENAKKRLLIPQPKVVDSTTESCGINNSLIKDLNTKGTQKEQKKRSASSSETSSDARAVFDFWHKTFSKGRQSLTADRERLIKARRRKFSVEELKRAITGVTFDDWLMGRDARSTTAYTDFKTIFKNDSKVETLIALADASAEAAAALAAASSSTPAAKDKSDEQQKLYDALLASSRAKSTEFQGGRSN